MWGNLDTRIALTDTGLNYPGSQSFYGFWQLSFNFYADFASELATEGRFFRASAGASESCLPQPGSLREGRAIR